jgi:hypothetical protein
MRANSKIKLNMQQEDKFENAWKRVVLGHGSKSEVSKTCGVGETTIAGMRRAVRAFTEGPEAESLLHQLGGRLEGESWWKVRAVWLGWDQKEMGGEERLKARAAALAKGLTSRMEDRLSRYPVVTAMALKLYDADLVEPLIDALIDQRKKTKEEQKRQQEVEDRGAYETLNEEYEAKMREPKRQRRPKGSTNGTKRTAQRSGHSASGSQDPAYARRIGHA